jgi:hypothetical protein
MAADIKVLAGDWSRLALTDGGLRLWNGVFAKKEFRGWDAVSDLVILSSDTAGRRKETSFTVSFGDGKKVFASAPGTAFHAMQTAYTAHKIAAERGARSNRAQWSVGKVMLALAASATVLTFIWIGLQPSSNAPQTSSYNPVREESDAIDVAEDAVRKILRDPASASFDDVHYRSSTRTVCGLVNSRNGFGGLSGAVPFFVSGGLPEVQPSPADPHYEPFRSMYNAECLD